MENLHIKSITDSSKIELEQLAGILFEQSEGFEIELYIFAKKLEFLSKAIQEISNESALNVAERLKGTTLFGSEINVRESGVKYDYSKCNYAPYNNLILQKKELESEQKTMESLLKAISKTTEIADAETGEIMTVKPPLRTAGTSIVLTIK
jgi:predicted RND superfamily exporter protein